MAVKAVSCGPQPPLTLGLLSGDVGYRALLRSASGARAPTGKMAALPSKGALLGWAFWQEMK